MGAYSVIRILISKSPYITFKKLLQKQKKESENDITNLGVLIRIGRSKNIKLRKSYLRFLEEYIHYIAEKKDSNFEVI